MVEIINGATKKIAISNILKEFFGDELTFEGILYIAYPILFAGEESITIDALWISPQYGILIFDFIETDEELKNYSERQDKIYSLLDGKLRTYPELRKGRKDFLVNIEIVSFAPHLGKSSDFLVTNKKELKEFIKNELSKWEHYKLYDKVLSVLQSVIHLKRKEKRLNVKHSNSKGAKLKNIEANIAVLDRNQEKAVIEYFEGVQRIRGLAGSGKTIVLALKAAYLHTQNPDWDIAVTFNTRSLKQQFKELITRFCIEKRGEEPDWKKIRVVNAWGSSKDSELEKGIYYDFCITNGIEYYDFRKARTISSFNQTPFEAVCLKAISKVKRPIPKYDAILVDEAQDLSESFIKLCFLFLKGNQKRLIYAYDELQKLNEGSPLRNPKEFLIDENEKFDDQILKVCYRNPRPLLVTAHALGFGIYRKKDNGKKELVQFFDQPQLWFDVGYQIESGKLRAGNHVTLFRPKETSPEYLENHSDIDDLIIFRAFKTKEEQAQWVANEIEKNLKEDELLFNDIIVINPIAVTTQKEVSLIRENLLKKGINNHIAGELNADVFFKGDSIAFTGINRAKGNEVPMVYIINAQDCYSGAYLNRDLIRRRNILFTAITRSKSWVRVVGVGDNMQKLIEEYNAIKQNSFKLSFIYPTEEEISRLNIIHRDISDKEWNERTREVRTLESLLQIVNRIKKGEAYIEDYPEEYQPILKELLNIGK
ncbi:MAG: helicase [Thermodesulfobacteriota bacterium]|nr:MAG: helicase [Thermodesulfobacteriota bacterium]